MNDSSGNWFGKLFKKVSQEDPGVTPKPTPKLDPRNADAWNNKGNSLNNLSRYEEAIFCFDKALELDPRNVTAWTNKGGSLGSLGRYQEAIPVSYTHLRAHETRHDLVCRLLLEKKKKKNKENIS